MRKCLTAAAFISAILIGSALAQPSTNGPSGTGPEGSPPTPLVCMNMRECDQPYSRPR
jgi:hypothetical protein